MKPAGLDDAGHGLSARRGINNAEAWRVEALVKHGLCAGADIAGCVRREALMKQLGASNLDEVKPLP